MSLKKSVVESLEKIVGESKVLTDVEDLHVYSFEQLFKGQQYHQLDAVIRTISEEQTKDILELAREQNVRVLRRGKGDEKSFRIMPKVTILVDDTPTPQLDPFLKKEEIAQLKDELREEMHKGGHGTFRNLAIGLKSFLSGLPSQKCLQCNVCSGYCTVSSSFNGVETWSSKGRTILTQALYNGELLPSTRLANILYTCSLCGLCFAQCFETTQVRKAIMDARHRLTEKSATPELFAATAKNISAFGDPSGMSSAKRVAWIERLREKPSSLGDTDLLLWAGCVMSTRTPNAVGALGSLLSRAHVSFSYLGEKEGCCGYVLVAAGLWREAKENAMRLVERVTEAKADVLVTPCAGCYYTFTKLYPEILNVELPLEISHATQYVEHLLQEERIKPRALDLKVTYHDPCSLGRHSNVFDAPRTVLKSIPDLDLLEMRLNRDRARCCGAGGGLWSFNNPVAVNSAAERLVKDVAPLGVSALVTACPTCHLNFRYTSVKKSMDIKVYDLMEIVESATLAAKE